MLLRLEPLPFVLLMQEQFQYSLLLLEVLQLQHLNLVRKVVSLIQLFGLALFLEQLLQLVSILLLEPLGPQQVLQLFLLLELELPIQQ